MRVFNDRGSFELRARVTDRARRGVVVALSVWWKKLARDGKNANELTNGDDPHGHGTGAAILRLPGSGGAGCELSPGVAAAAWRSPRHARPPPMRRSGPVAIAAGTTRAARTAQGPLPRGGRGLKLPAGFCASIFADDIGHARHLVMAPNGVLYVNTWSGRYYGNDHSAAGGFLVALQDTTGSGKADVTDRFGETVQPGEREVLESASSRARSSWKSTIRSCAMRCPPGSIVPQGASERWSPDCPSGAITHASVRDRRRRTHVHRCRHRRQIRASCKTARCALPGPEAVHRTQDPRGHLALRGEKADIKSFRRQERFATGIRNAEGFGIDTPAHRIFVTQHGRDQLHANWPDLYPPEQEATLPAEELLRLTQGGDYGWPECYYDAGQGALVLAPEYGGDGGKRRGDMHAKNTRRSRHSPPIGRRTAWRSMIGSSSRRITAVAYSLRSTARGTGRHTQKGTTSRFDLSAAAGARGLLRDLCRWVCGRAEITRYGPTSADGNRGRTRRRALRFGRRARPDLSHRISRAARHGGRECVVHPLSRRHGTGGAISHTGPLKNIPPLHRPAPALHRPARALHRPARALHRPARASPVFHTTFTCCTIDGGTAMHDDSIRRPAVQRYQGSTR